MTDPSLRAVFNRSHLSRRTRVYFDAGGITAYHQL